MFCHITQLGLKCFILDFHFCQSFESLFSHITVAMVDQCDKFVNRFKTTYFAQCLCSFKKASCTKSSATSRRLIIPKAKRNNGPSSASNTVAMLGDSSVG